jgi:hypothetical protein
LGDWNWRSTGGRIAVNIYETPERNGKIISLNLLGNYQYSLMENGSEIPSGIYELIMIKSMYSLEMERFIQFSEKNTQEWLQDK